MADAPSKGMVKGFVGLHTFLYRLSGGAIGGKFGQAPVLILTVKGRKSGKLQTIPLCYVKTERGYAVIASFRGAPSHPTWYLNLEAAGVATIEVGRRKIGVRSETVPFGSERYQALWRAAVAIYPDYESYRQRTTREIPIVELVPL